jgi:hypothetical protein
MLILKIWKLNKLRVTPSETQINVFIQLQENLAPQGQGITIWLIHHYITHSAICQEN